MSEPASIEIPDDGPAEIVAHDFDEAVKDASTEIAKSFTDLIVAGTAPETAAREVTGDSLEKMKANPVIRQKVQELIRDYKLPAGVRREVVRARLNQAILEAKSVRDIAQVAGVIASDPEVGLKTEAPLVQVGVVSETTRVFLENVDPNEEI